MDANRFLETVRELFPLDQKGMHYDVGAIVDVDGTPTMKVWCNYDGTLAIAAEVRLVFDDEITVECNRADIMEWGSYCRFVGAIGEARAKLADLDEEVLTGKREWP